MQELRVSSFFSLESYSYKNLFESCAYPWEALAKLKIFLEKQTLGEKESAIAQGVYLVHPELITIGKGCVIEPGAFIQGPCVIGENCEIRCGAYIRGNVVMGNDCVIGHGSEIKHSILLNSVHMGHFNYVGDSILGNFVNLGAGVKCANLRLDHAPITIHLQQGAISTKLNKLGAVIGDYSQVGCNSVTNPGTIIGRNTFCHPCMAIHGFIPHFSKVKSTQKMVIEDNVNTHKR